MPGRLIPLVSGQIYHIFNRGIDKRPTFTNKLEYKRALETINFYRVGGLPVRLSRFLLLESTRKLEIIKLIEKTAKLVKIICFCLMPNHFHFLLKQEREKGIATFLSNFQNSYTRYFNTRHERDGSLFLDQFKAKLIEDDKQLIHVSRYIHLNPYTSFITESLQELENYQWSSLPSYLKNEASFLSKGLILNNFRSVNEYKKFVFDQADYQRRLKEIKHLTFE